MARSKLKPVGTFSMTQGNTPLHAVVGVPKDRSPGVPGQPMIHRVVIYEAKEVDGEMVVNECHSK